MLRPERRLEGDDEFITFYHLGPDGYHGRRRIKRGEPPPSEEPWLMEIPLAVGDELPLPIQGEDHGNRRPD